MSREINIDYKKETCLQLDNIYFKYYDKKVSHHLFYVCLKLDPTTILYKNSSIPIKMGIYCKWILNLCTHNLLSLENSSLLYDSLNIFHKIKDKLSAEQKDISFFKTVNDLSKFIENYKDLARIKYQTRNYFKQIKQYKNLTIEFPDKQDVIFNNQDVHIINTENNLKLTSYCLTLNSHVVQCLKHHRFFKYRLLQGITIYIIFFKHTKNYVLAEVHSNNRINYYKNNIQGKIQQDFVFDEVSNKQLITALLVSKPLTEQEEQECSVLESVRTAQILPENFITFFQRQPIHLQIEIVRLVSSSLITSKYVTPYFLQTLDKEMRDEFVEGISYQKNFNILCLLNKIEFKRVINKDTALSLQLKDLKKFFLIEYETLNIMPYRYYKPYKNMPFHLFLSWGFYIRSITKNIIDTFETLDTQQRKTFLQSGPVVPLSFLTRLTIEEVFIYCYCRRYFNNNFYFEIDYFVECFFKNIIYNNINFDFHARTQ